MAETRFRDKFQNANIATNYLVTAILPKYESAFAKALLGKRFPECYDVTQMAPSREWNSIYQSVTRESREIGLELHE